MSSINAGAMSKLDAGLVKLFNIDKHLYPKPSKYLPTFTPKLPSFVATLWFWKPNHPKNLPGTLKPNSKFAPGNACLEYQYKVSFLGICLPIFQVHFYCSFQGVYPKILTNWAQLKFAPTLSSWELDSAKDSTRFLINSRAHRACWSALQGEKNG